MHVQECKNAEQQVWVHGEAHPRVSGKWGGGFESLLNGFSIGPSAHLDPGWKADVAIYPHLPQTQLSVGPHPELQGDLSLPGRNTGDDQEEAEQSGVLFFLTPPPF